MHDDSTPLELDPATGEPVGELPKRHPGYYLVGAVSLYALGAIGALVRYLVSAISFAWRVAVMCAIALLVFDTVDLFAIVDAIRSAPQSQVTVAFLDPVLGLTLIGFFMAVLSGPPLPGWVESAFEYGGRLWERAAQARVARCSGKAHA